MQTALCRTIPCAPFALVICLLAGADEPSPRLTSGGEALHVPPIVDPLGDQRPERVAAGHDHHFFFDEARPLDLNLERVAILRPEGQAPIVPAPLTAIGVGDADLAAFAIEGWSLAELPDVVRAARDVETLVAASAQEAGVAFVSPVFVGEDGGPLFVTPDILVGFHRHVGAAEAEAVLADSGAGAITDVDWGGMPGAYRVRSGARNGFEVLAAANALARRPEVRFAEPDMIFTGHGTGFPNDLGFGNCWGLHNVGFAPDMDMDAPQAWDVTIGDPSIVVVVIDTGVQQDHPDLHQIPGTDTTSQGPGDGGPVNECDNHGTPVAGCVSAHIDNGIGTVGVAPGCVSASARTFISNLACNGSWSSQASWTVDTLDWAETIGARVSNNSNRYGFQSSAIALKYEETRNNGMVHFAAAGNDATSSCVYPSSLPTVNAVAALNRWGELASFSNWGSCLALSAPGAWIHTLDRTGADGWSNGDYVYSNGTSFASPYAAGVAALILSQNPALDAGAVEVELWTSAMDLGDPGEDDVFGWGFVNASAAVSGSDAETCGAGAGDCLSAHGGVGCDDAACCTYVCLADPGCCEIAWDQSCADAAQAACDIAFSGSTIRVSVDSDGIEGNSDSFWPRIADDAPHLSAFDGYADNLVDHDTNGVSDVFVHDAISGQTERVSVVSGGGQGNGNSWLCELSADGRHVLFHSVANNLAAGGDTNGTWDVFVHDRDNDTTARVSVASDGTQANSLSLFGSITPNGRYVVFFSDANNLVADDMNNATDTFVIDRDVDGNGVFDEAGGIETTRVSVSSTGDEGNAASGDYNGVCPQITPDGRYVVFLSLASNFDAMDTNGTWDTFVHDRQSGETHRMSISSDGTGANGWSRLADVSASGRFVIFSSTATNLVAGDTNGMHDVFVHDRDPDEDGVFDEPGEVETTRVSVASDGSESNGVDGVCAISSNGRYVAFNSTASNLGVDFNYRLDIYVHDRATGKTRLASAGTDGIGDGNSFWPHVSARGQYVAFHSYSDNLVPDDSGAFRDVFVRDLGVLCPWDLDNSGSVGTADLLDLLSQWGTDPGGPPDFDGDGSVGTSDLLKLLSNWGECD